MYHVKSQNILITVLNNSKKVTIAYSIILNNVLRLITTSPVTTGPYPLYKHMSWREEIAQLL